jgi:hypothetical protein
VPPSINIFNEQQSWSSTIGGSKPNLGTVYVRAFPCYVVPCRQTFQRGGLVFKVHSFGIAFESTTALRRLCVSHSFKMIAFWDVAPCSLVEADQSYL